LKGKGIVMTFEVSTNPNKHLSEKIQSAFDQTNVLIEEKMLDEDLILKLYAGMIIRSWRILEYDIASARKKNKNISLGFEKLYKKSCNYYVTVLKEDIPEPY